jgi:hypothetical protein
MAEVASRGSRADEVRTERRRKPGSVVAQGLKLHVPDAAKDDNYVYRWVNDTGQRVQQMTDNDWDPAPYEGKSTEARVVGTDGGKPTNGILMRKRKDWHEADQKDKRKNLAEVDKAIQRGTVHATAGEADLSGVDYTPGNGNSITRG